ncbi:MAG: hypothetical protein JW874_02720 [Spirochaetales bacterium]|nr:hypothetical protein [Spirochaetales bacterium]
MIEKMQKISVLMLHSGSAGFLQKLQDLGVVHLEWERFAETEELTGLQDQIITLKKTEAHLHDFRETDFTHKPQIFHDAALLRAEVDRLVSDLTHLHVRREAMHKQAEQLRPWGEFDPDLISKLEEKNVHLSFFTLSKQKFASLDLSGHDVQVINDAHKQVHFVIVSEGGPDFEETGLQEDQVPMLSLEQVRKDLAVIEKEIRDIESLLGGYYKQKSLIEEKISELEDRKEYLLATLTLQPEADGHVMQLSGFVPVSDQDKVGKFLDANDVVYLFEEPEDNEKTPIKLKNRPAARLFEPITKMYGLPNYSELDTTPFFAPFFAFFFGVCLGDVGYGSIVLVGSIILLLGLKNKSLKSFLKLGVIFGITTIVAGVLLNTVFGNTISSISALPKNFLKLVLLKDTDSAMIFAILLGITQMLFGLVLQMINRIKEHGFFGIMTPLGIMLIMLGIFPLLIVVMSPNMVMGPLLIGKPLSSIPDGKTIFIVMIAAGVFTILFLSNLEVKKVNPGKGLWDLYNIIVGILGDTLSYIRLFALGLSGAMLGGAFNEIAMMVKGSHPNIITIFFMIVILLLGHTLTFALGALGAFVHPLRLTFVEFYKAVGFSGGGKMYTPFTRKIAINGGKK